MHATISLSQSAVHVNCQTHEKPSKRFGSTVKQICLALLLFDLRIILSGWGRSTCSFTLNICLRTFVVQVYLMELNNFLQTTLYCQFQYSFRFIKINAKISIVSERHVILRSLLKRDLRNVIRRQLQSKFSLVL